MGRNVAQFEYQSGKKPDLVQLPGIDLKENSPASVSRADMCFS